MNVQLVVPNSNWNFITIHKNVIYEETFVSFVSMQLEMQNMF